MLVLNPLIRLKWQTAEVKKNDTFLIEQALEKKKLLVNSDVYPILFYFLAPRSKAEVRKFAAKLEKERKATAKDIAKAIAYLKMGKILVENTSQEYGDYDLWIKRGWRNSLDFHLNTRDNRFADIGSSKDMDNAVRTFKQYGKETAFPAFFKSFKRKIGLPRAVASDMSLGDAFFKRRTTRAFSKAPVTLQELSNILYFSLRPVGNMRKYIQSNVGDQPLMYMASDSTPYEVYFAANNVAGLGRGIYHYNMEDHTISLVRKGAVNAKMSRIAIGQAAIKSCSVVFLVSAVFERYMWRYRSSRSFRDVLFGCSMLAHRLILNSVSFNIRTFITPAFKDTQMDALIKAERYKEAVLYLVGIGK